MAATDSAPRFVLFVRSVEGRLVPRFGGTGWIGARVHPVTEEQRLAGVKRAIEWDTERVVPVTEVAYRIFRREYDKALRNGNLKKATESEFSRWLETQKAREAKRDAEREKAKAEREKAAKKAEADAPAPDKSNPPGESSGASSGGSEGATEGKRQKGASEATK
jgi:hypothetical protein